MKILIAVHTYWPDHNGVQNVTEYIAEGLARKGHQVRVIVGLPVVKVGQQGYGGEDQHGGLSIKRIHAELNPSGGHEFIGDRQAYLDEIRDYRPDVLMPVCTQSWPFDWLIPEIDSGEFDSWPMKKVLYTHGYTAYLKQYPVLKNLLGGHIHQVQDNLFWKKYFDRLGERLQHFDLVTYLARTSSSYEYAQEHGLTNEMILGNAVEDAMFVGSSLDRQDNAQPVFIYVANYGKGKDQEKLMRAFYRAKTSCPLILIGGQDNDYYQNLLRLQKELEAQEGHHDVTLQVGLTRPQIMDQMRQADVFVCTSRHEEFPIMLCEAAAKGLAIITTRVGNVEEFPCVRIVDSDVELSEAITEASASLEDRIRSGRELRAYAERNFRIEDKVEALHERLIKL